MIFGVPKLGFWTAYALAIGLYLTSVGLTRLMLH